MVVYGAHDLFRPLRLIHPLAVRSSREQLGLKTAAVQLAEGLTPGNPNLVVIGVRPIHRRGSWQDALRIHGEVVGDLGDAKIAEDLLRLSASLPADRSEEHTS